MAGGWRGAVQRVLRGAADRLETATPKRWTAESQRIGVAIGATLVLATIVAAGVLVAVAAKLAPPSGCTDAECVQYMWQGRWAMVAAGVSLLALVGTFAGLIFVAQNVTIAREERADANVTRKREYRGYLQVRIDGIEQVGDILYAARLSVRNYGRTPVSNLNGYIVVDPWRPIARNEKEHLMGNTVQPFSFERLIHPGEWQELEVFPWFGCAPDLYEGNDHNLFVTISVGHIEYDDAFSERHRENQPIIRDYQVSFHETKCQFKLWRGGVVNVFSGPHAQPSTADM